MLVSSQMSSDHVLGRVLTDGNVLEDLEMPSYFPAGLVSASIGCACGSQVPSHGQVDNVYIDCLDGADRLILSPCPLLFQSQEEEQTAEPQDP